MFVDSIRNAFARRGYRVEPGKGRFDLFIEMGGYMAGVMALDYQKRASHPNVEARLKHFRSQQKVLKVWIGASKGFSTAAVSEYFKAKRRLSQGREVELFELEGEEIREVRQMPVLRLMIGVVTAKGGVGKTTISAHLAGVFAAMGYPVTLVDLDPESNLKSLLGESVDFPLGPQGRAGRIAVFAAEDWKDDTVSSGIVVCDCSPVVARNPRRVVKKFDICLIPTTLNPLGLSKNGKVIVSTIEQIRAVNPTAHLFVMINNFYPEDRHEIGPLIRSYKQLFEEILKQDDRVHFVEPTECAIRNHKDLFYWGREVCENQSVKLAISSIEDGSSGVLKDYLGLVDYLERSTPIQDTRKG